MRSERPGQAECGAVDLDLLLRQHLGLAVERQMMIELPHQDMADHPEAGFAARHGLAGGGRLNDRLAGAAGELRPHMTDDHSHPHQSHQPNRPPVESLNQQDQSKIHKAAYGPRLLTKSWEEHDAIVTAIMRGDGTVAGEAARAHVATVSNASAVFASSS